MIRLFSIKVEVLKALGILGCGFYDPGSLFGNESDTSVKFGDEVQLVCC